MNGLTWAVCLPWTKLYQSVDGLYEYVKCIVCLSITGEPKILGPKNMLKKHGGKKKATKNMANGIKKRQ